VNQAPGGSGDTFDSTTVARSLHKCVINQTVDHAHADSTLLTCRKAGPGKVTVLAMWGTDGVLEATHATPFGEMPGSVVVNFPTVDAIMHAWDLSASVGHPIEFRPEAIPAISAVVAATCTDEARAAGLIRPPTRPPADSSATERLVAAAGRSTRR
jgi:uncharacterized protein (TIGR03086 family)